MPVAGASQQIQKALLSWPGVGAAPHRFGGVEFRLGTREIGHMHGDWLVDIPFPTKVRDELVAAGLAEPHHVMPESGWVSFYLRAEQDVPAVIDLLRRSYEIAARQKPKREHG
jgi:hypothetical protein